MVSRDVVFDESWQVQDTSTAGDSDDNDIVEIFEDSGIYPSPVDDAGAYSDSNEAS